MCQLTKDIYRNVWFEFIYYLLFINLLIFFVIMWRLDSNIKSKSSNKTYLNIIKIFNNIFI